MKTITCHKPKNPYWDLSLLQTGDEVISFLYPGLMGKVEIKYVEVTTGHSYDIVSVQWSDGTQSFNYPNQLRKIKCQEVAA